MPHTPGPWTYAYEGSGSHNVYDLAADDLIASCCGDKGFDESTANAYLIAQAPAMYELLKFLEFSSTPYNSNPTCPACGYGEEYGHEANCKLAAVLKAAEGDPCFPATEA